MIEERIFLNELSKRIEKNCIWKNYTEKLFLPEIISYSPKQISLIKDLLFSHMPSDKRAEFWFIASGAKREMHNNKGYYNSLLNNFPDGTQTPAEEALRLDISRTFPNHPFFKNDENKKKLTNILTAFVRRNATIGYSQGFNFIAGKLLYIVGNEEKVFWIFTQIVENYLPGDFYLLFSGVRKDMKVIQKIIKKELRFLDTNVEMCISNLISKCFISLFAQNFPDNILFTIWDAFFIYGEIVLYRAFIWLAYLHYDKSLINLDIDTINETIINKMKNIKNLNSLYYFLYLYDSVNNNLIRLWRKKMELTTLEETKLNRPITKKDLKCDRTKPFCLFNKEENNISKNKHFIVHKTHHEIKIFNNYFFDDVNVKKEEEQNNNLDIPNTNSADELNISSDSLLIERHRHICPEDKE